MSGCFPTSAGTGVRAGWHAAHPLSPGCPSACVPHGRACSMQVIGGSVASRGPGSSLSKSPGHASVGMAAAHGGVTCQVLDGGMDGGMTGFQGQRASVESGRAAKPHCFLGGGDHLGK